MMIEKLEKYIDENYQDGIFYSYIEIEKITGVDIHEVINIIDDSSDIYMNGDLEFTTRKMYNKYRGSWRKFLDMFAGRII